MKKSLFAMVAVGAVTLASCSSDEMAGPAGSGDGNVIITAQLPTELQSRAYGDGTVAKTLSYAVYDGDDVIFASDVPGSPAPVAVDAKNFTLSLNLVKGKTYDLLFWADATTGSPYTFTSSTKSVTVNYDNLGNNENRDAFFQAVKGLTVNGPVQQTVELRRPFAQVNIGTNDLADAEKAGLEVATTTMTVAGVYDTLNLLTGVASASEDVTLTYTAAVPENETFPVNGYEYLAMNYILSGTEVTENDVQAASRELIDITYKVTCTDGHEIDYSFTNVPVQRNYRTNIYGSLLTNPADFNIVVIPGFNDPDIDNEILADSPEDIVNAFKGGQDIVVAENKDIDLSGTPAADLVIDVPITIEIPAGSSIKLGAENYITVNNGLTIKGGAAVSSRSGETVIANGILTNEGEPSEEGVAKELIRVYGGDLVIENMTIINDMNHHWHGPKTNSSAIAYWNDANVTITNSTIKSGEFTLCGMGRGVASGKVILTNSYFESTSSNIHNGRNWAYAMRIFGSESILTNCEVKGIQGAVSAEETNMTIKSGKYYTVNSEGRTDAYYAVYVTNGGTVTIEDGEFSGANNRDALAEGKSCVVSGDNDVDLPTGSIIIKGGKFSGKAYNHVTNEVYQPESWVPIEGDDPFKWTVNAQ